MDNPQNNNDHVQQTNTSDGRPPVDGMHVLTGEPVTRDEDDGGKNVYCAEQKDNIVNSGRVKNGILDIFYGVLFDPGRTFAGFAQNPPITAIVLIFVALNLAEALTGVFTAPLYLDKINFAAFPGVADASQAMLSFVAVAGFFFSVIKWFFMAGLLHLLAELYGGNGTARSVWAVYGIAGLPAVFMIPLQIVISLVNMGGFLDFIAALLTLGLYVWGVLLLIIGLRETHCFSTGRAALTVMTPVLMLLFLALVALIFMGTVVSTIMGAPNF